MTLPYSPASERNRTPILEVLQRLLPASGRALEIASGTGQHAAFFAKALPAWRWQPTDCHDQAFDAIRAWAAHEGAPNVLPPRRVDVCDADWPSDDGAPFASPFGLIFCANMLHISPWATCDGLMRGAARHLAPRGLLVTYGPYLEDEVPTAASNRAFDADLRARNPQWGIRRRDDVARVASEHGLALTQRHPMPSNNLLLVFARAP